MSSAAQQHLDLNAADAYGRSFADIYDQWYHDVTDRQATAKFVASRHPGGLVVELGVGTGRLAQPMAAQGLTVVGLDGSADMLASLTDLNGILALRADLRALPFRPGARPNGSAATAGDPVARSPRADEIGTALIAFNTIFNLASEHDQRRFLAELAASIAPTGIVIIEALDTTALLDGPRYSIGKKKASTDGVVATATHLNSDTQQVTGQHICIDDDSVSVHPWALRWATPHELDRMAAAAGLRLVDRFADWDGHPFNRKSTSHISLYRLV